jgi:hypothetical protein
MHSAPTTGRIYANRSECDTWCGSNDIYSRHRTTCTYWIDDRHYRCDTWWPSLEHQQPGYWGPVSFCHCDAISFGICTQDRLCPARTTTRFPSINFGICASLSCALCIEAPCTRCIYSEIGAWIICATSECYFCT